MLIDFYLESYQQGFQKSFVEEWVSLNMENLAQTKVGNYPIEKKRETPFKQIPREVKEKAAEIALAITSEGGDNWRNNYRIVLRELLGED